MNLNPEDKTHIKTVILSAISKGEVINTFDFTRDEIQEIRDWVSYTNACKLLIDQNRQRMSGIAIESSLELIKKTKSPVFLESKTRTKILKNLFPNSTPHGSAFYLSVLELIERIDIATKTPVILVLNQGNAIYCLFPVKYALTPWLKAVGMRLAEIDRLFARVD